MCVSACIGVSLAAKAFGVFADGKTLSLVAVLYARTLPP